MKSTTPEALYREGVFQIQSNICGVTFSDNILITQLRINERETELVSIYETSLPLTSRISPSMIL